MPLRPPLFFSRPPSPRSRQSPSPSNLSGPSYSFHHFSLEELSSTHPNNAPRTNSCVSVCEALRGMRREVMTEEDAQCKDVKGWVVTSMRLKSNPHGCCLFSPITSHAHALIISDFSFLRSDLGNHTTVALSRLRI